MFTGLIAAVSLARRRRGRSSARSTPASRSSTTIDPAAIAGPRPLRRAGRPGDRGPRLRALARPAVPRPLRRGSARPQGVAPRRLRTAARGDEPRARAPRRRPRAVRADVAGPERRAAHRRARRSAPERAEHRGARPQQAAVRRGPTPVRRPRRPALDVERRSAHRRDLDPHDPGGRPRDRRRRAAGGVRDRDRASGCAGWCSTRSTGSALDARAVTAGDVEHEIDADRPAELAGPRTTTSRRCATASSTTWPRSSVARGPARPAGPGAEPLERGARAVRVRRVARPAGAAAQGHELLPAARAALRRPARRAREAVPRLRGRRRQADAAAHPRPARVLAGRPDHGRVRARSTCARRPPQAVAEPRRPDRRAARRRRGRRPPDGARRPDAADRAVPEPGLERDQVQRLGRPTRHDQRARPTATAGSSRARTTASASSRSTRTGCS